MRREGECEASVLCVNVTDDVFTELAVLESSEL